MRASGHFIANAKHGWLQWVLTVVVCCATRGIAEDFIHPGCLSTRADIEWMADRVAAGAEPWLGSWQRLTANPHAQLNHVPNPQVSPCAGSVCNGESFMPMAHDCAAAYQCALRYLVSGDTRYADKAVEIMNAWAATMVQWSGDSNAQLRAGLYGYQWACAAELLRDYPGWAASEFQAFQNMLLNLFYPVNSDFLARHNGTCWDHYWANWDLATMCSMIAIGVLCDNRAIFDEAVDYFKWGVGTGSIDHAVVHVHADGLGQWQESGRDQGHATLGIGLMAVFCEIAWNQGIDLYGYGGNRFLAGSEYVTKYNLGEDVPWITYTNCEGWTMTEVSSAARGSMRPGMDMIVNHYVYRMGLPAPYTVETADLMRPDGGGGDYGSNSGGFDLLGFSTLTHTGAYGTGGVPEPPDGSSPAPTRVAHYAFEGNVTDETAHYDATTGGDPAYGPGWNGQAVVLDGVDDYVILPAGVADSTEITVATWVNWGGSGGSWQRVFDFGNDTSRYLFLTVNSASDTLRFAAKLQDGAEQFIDADPLTEGWHHLAVTLGEDHDGRLYVDGMQVGSAVISWTPASISPAVNYLGKSQWPDALFTGSLDEFRLYNFALSSQQVGDLLAGLDVVGDGQAVPTNTWFRLTPRHASNRCLTVAGNGAGNGMSIVQGIYTGADNQLWRFEDDGLGWYRITPRSATGRCVDVTGASVDSGANVILWDALGGANQQWTFVATDNGYHAIMARHSDKCLDVADASTADGANVQQWDYWGGGNQQWLLTEEIGVKRVRNRATGLYLDGYGLVTNGEAVRQQANTTHPNAKWRFVKTGTAYYIVNEGTEMKLDGYGRTTNGDACAQYAGSTTPPNAQWELIPTGNNYFIRNRATGMKLDGYGRTQDGSVCSQYSGSTTHPNAQWELVD